jgi:hypothetical protein
MFEAYIEYFALLTLDMPDCALHRSVAGANCEVVELEDGTSAIVSFRDITVGEFFCVLESDSEDEEEEEELEDDDCA